MLKTSRIQEAMQRADRGNYANKWAYYDMPQPIGYDQTISAPHMHAWALEQLKDHLRPGAHVLDVGSGSGFLCTVFGLLVEPNGKVVGIDIYDGLVEQSKRNLEKDHPELLERKLVELKVGDGWKGDPGHAPFDAIHVGAAASSIPRALVDQLKPGGRMVIPVGEEWSMQSMVVLDKRLDGSIVQREELAVRYVPLQKVDEKSLQKEKEREARSQRESHVA
jgi:protein-L-isoaspartate(D-aspartate) O-methyltransferase